MTLLLHDSRTAGHTKWLLESIGAGHADGAVLNPFATPWVGRSANPSAADVVAQLRAAVPDARILLDASTHGAMLPGTDMWNNYTSWSLWPVNRRLDTTSDIADHCRVVFQVQDQLDVANLAPSVAVDSPNAANARTALDMARESLRQRPGTMLTLAARTSFWRAGSALDAYVGQLVRLRPAGGWYVVLVHDQGGYPPDLTDADATAGWLRTVHSLSLRSPVIAAHSDFVGLAAAAAGADTVGTGWYQAQRACSVDSFKEAGGGSYRLYAPHPGLLARFTDTVATGVADLADRFARSMRWENEIPANEAQHREQHFVSLRDHVRSVIDAGAGPQQRVPVARTILDGADMAWDHVVGLGAAGVGGTEKRIWFQGLQDGFETYARAEGL